MNIHLDKLDSITQSKYKDFQVKVEELLKKYQETDKERFNLVKDKIQQTNGDWDIVINLINENSNKSVEISQLLAYEYCLASERITEGKVSFEDMLDKLFNGVQKFRIGNPVPGMDDECLYGRSFNDERAIPVTSKLYRMVMQASAQHLNYLKNGEFTGAVFIYERGIIKEFAKDENGNSLDMQTNGIDFRNLSKGQSLLTNLRQTVFHEWTHNSEKENIDYSKDTIDYEYQGVDGKTYRNYVKVNSYVTSENISSIQEPQYIISNQRDLSGNRKRYYQDKDGNLRPLSEVKFELDKKQLGKEYCFSSGLTTQEVMPNGETKTHNIITEGFVERTARAMIKSIEPQVIDIDEKRYSEYVEMAKRVIEARDISFGKNGQGKTYSDFLMHSSILKRELESKIVLLEKGKKIDGLHYISDYADRVQSGQTMKLQFYRNIPSIVGKLKLSKTQIDKLNQFNLLQKRELTKEEQNDLRTLLVGGNLNNQLYVDKIVAEFIETLEEETNFFDSLSEKLGYSERVIDESNDITWQDIGKGTTQSFSKNPEKVSKAMASLEYRVKAQKEIKEGQTKEEG